MVSFEQLWESMDKSGASPLMDSGEDGEILGVVRAGKDLRKEDEASFWDDFISLCSDSRGFAQLLDVPSEKVINWPAKIRENLDKLERHDAESPNIQQDTDVAPTGENGAFMVPPTNTDPNLGAM